MKEQKRTKKKLILACDTFEKTTLVIEKRDDNGLFIEVDDSNTDRLPTVISLDAKKKEQLTNFLDKQ